MKQFYFFLLIIPFLFLSCDKINDANTVDFDTNITMGMEVNVNDANAMVIKSVQINYPFSSSGTASLVENYQIADYLDNIKSIEVKDLKITFVGLNPGTAINTITLSVDGVGEIASLSNVTNTSATHSPSIDSSKLTKIASVLRSNWLITATVSGTTDSAPMWFSINMVYDLHVEAKAL